MTIEKINWDVAFSFLSKDEDLAYKIKDQLSGYNCFIYSEHQDKLTGKNGVIVFQKMFKNLAKVVVVLYKKDYGKIGMTDVEEIAITDRLTRGKSNTIIIVSLDKSKPEWLIPNIIYFDFIRFGFKGLVGAIHAKISELGGEIKSESFADKINILNRKKEFQKFKNDYFRSADSAKNALAEVDIVLKHIEDKENILYSFGIRLDGKETSPNHRSSTYHWKQYLTLNIYWHCHDNSTYGTKLSVVITKISVIPERISDLFNEEYSFDLLSKEVKGWHDGEKFYTSIDLSEYIMQRFIEIIENEERPIH